VTIEIVAKLRPQYCCDSTTMDKDGKKSRIKVWEVSILLGGGRT